MTELDQIHLKHNHFDARLPGAACSASLLSAAENYAKNENVSVSAVVRYALAVFLRSEYRNFVQISENSLPEED